MSDWGVKPRSTTRMLDTFVGGSGKRETRRGGELKRLNAMIPAALPSVDGSNPAISGHRKSGHFRRPETGVEFYLTAPCVGKVVWTLVRQLRGPHFSTCA